MTQETRGEAAQLRRYLLGHLEEAAMAELEDRLLGDAELFDQLEAVLDDLDDDYAAGRLVTADRQRYEERFASTPEGRTRLLFARALDTHLYEIRVPAQPAAPPSFFRQMAGLVRGQRLAFQWAFAAAVTLLVVGPSVAVIQVTQLRQHVAGLEGALLSETGRARAAGTVASETRARLLAAEQRLANLTTVTFDLLPGVSRGPAELTIGTLADVVRVRLALEQPLARADVRVELLTASGTTAWSVLLDSTATRDPVALTVTLPGTVLRPGEYLLRVSARRPVAVAVFDEFASYAFRMRPR